MTLRIAHATDIHWQTRPGLHELGLKRILGTANLYLAGRRHHFQRAVQDALVEHLVALAPDLVVITGDLTAQALPAEFATARSALQPVLDRFPTFVIPGNHDAYTTGAMQSQRIREHFSAWMGLSAGPVTRHEIGDVVCLGLDPNRPTWVNATGVLPKDQLEALATALEDPALEDRFVVLCIHYPLVGRDGQPYDDGHHGLLNVHDLIQTLEAAPVIPDLVLHGHEHHGYRSSLSLSGDRVLSIFDCGSSGYAFMPKKRRAAAMNVYTVQDGALAGVERYLYDGSGFAPEPGGAYATGR